jgi:hypothetical protein
LRLILCIAKDGAFACSARSKVRLVPRIQHRIRVLNAASQVPFSTPRVATSSSAASRKARGTGGATAPKVISLQKGFTVSLRSPCAADCQV